MSLVLENIGHTVEGESHLTDINLNFESGSFNVLLGRTLAGKTTLMRVIAGLERPSEGKVVLNGKDITDVAVQKRNVSMVYQQFINYPHLTVWENIASPLKLAKLAPSEIKKRVAQTAEMLLITDYLQRKPLELSGGQQQRCAMARALVKDAQIILFDEPLVNLDYKLRESLRHELKSLFKSRESIAIYATTESAEALALGGTTCLLHQGKVLQTGPALEQFYHPKNLQAADLCNEPPLNRFQASIHKQQLSFIQDISLANTLHLKELVDANYHFAIRPDHLTLQSSNQPELVLQAVVDLAEISASETYLHVTINNGVETLSWVAHLNGIYQFHTGVTLTLFAPLALLYVFDQNDNAQTWPNLLEAKH